MGKAIDLTGKRFGRLVVTSRAANNTHEKTMWHCVCDCGAEKAVQTAKLRSGESRSCGCLRLDVVRSVNVTHGKSFSRIYLIWRAMLGRCHNPKVPAYARYGARGIFVCDEWRNSFETFYAAVGDAPDGLSLDRIDNNKGYEPGNVRWATPMQQSRNSSKPKLFTHAGKTMNITEWAKELGVSQPTLWERLQKWPIEEALSTGKTHKSKRVKITRL